MKYIRSFMNSFLKTISRSKQLSLAHSKIKLSQNIPLSSSEFSLVCRICDVFSAISDTVGEQIVSPPVGGVFWENARAGFGPFDLFRRKDKCEIEHLFLLFNAFRDFCSLAYEYDEYTPKPDYWIRRYTRLCRNLPDKWKVRILPRFGEIGWNIEGFPINRWTSVNQERINLVKLAGIDKHLENQSVARIMEIGAGAGELGYAIMNAIPNAAWYDVDLLGCLIYSAIHLSIALPDKRHLIYTGNLELADHIDKSLIITSAAEASTLENSVIYIPNFLINDFYASLDLHFAYNTFSFGEMPGKAVELYCKLLAHFLRKNGILYEQNGYFPKRGGENPESILARYFYLVQLPPQFDGRWCPNGPARFWSNSTINSSLQHVNDDTTVANLIYSFNDEGDILDIKYPNDILWPKVYERIGSHQRVTELYPWNHQV